MGLPVIGHTEEKKAGRVYWFTGLSGAGKTTLCRELVTHLRSLNYAVVMLDGDELREAMGATNAHTREERLELAMRYSHLCHLIAEQGIDDAMDNFAETFESKNPIYITLLPFYTYLDLMFMVGYKPTLAKFVKDITTELRPKLEAELLGEKK